MKKKITQKLYKWFYSSYLGALLNGSPEDQAANAAKSVDSDLGHGDLVF